MSGGRALVIGASGLVGRALMRALSAAQIRGIGTYARNPSDGLAPLNITNQEQIRDCLQRIRPDTIFLTAALTHVDYCEDHPAEAFKINVEGPRAIATEARALGAKLVFYSTEYVFDGKTGPYDEESQTSPLSVYGQTKLAAELVIRGVVEDALIIRTTVVYGWENDSINFAMQIFHKVQAGEKMTIPADQIGNPTLAEYLAEVSVSLVQLGVSGVVNVVGKDLVPRTDFAKALVKLYGGDPELVVPVSTASLNQRAPRPLRGGLRTDKMARLLGGEVMGLDEALQRLRRRWEVDVGMV